MKMWKWVVSVFFLGVGGAEGAEDPLSPAERESETVTKSAVTLYLEYVDVAERDFLELTERIPKEEGTALREEVQKLVEAGVAKVEETVLVQGLPERASTLSAKLVVEKPDGKGHLSKGRRFRVDRFEIGAAVGFVPQDTDGDAVTFFYSVAIGLMDLPLTPGKEPTPEFSPFHFAKGEEIRSAIKLGEFHLLGDSTWPDGKHKGAPGRRGMLFGRVMKSEFRFEKQRGAVPEIPKNGGVVDPFALAPGVAAHRELSPSKPLKDPGGFTMQLQAIRVPHDAVTKMLMGFAPKPGEDAGALREEVARLIDRGEAELIEFSLIRSSAYWAKARSVSEVVVPELFEWQAAGGDPPDSGRSIATEFEVEQEVGLSVKWDNLVACGGSWIECDLEFSLKRRIESKWVAAGLDGAPRLDLPRFYTERVRTWLVLPMGGTALVGITSPGTEAGGRDSEFRTLFFVRANYEDGK